MRKIRWGLIGAGGLLPRWMNGAKQVDGIEISAIASRTRETAQRRSSEYSIPDAMTYDEILARRDLDVLYILTPHTAHKDLAIRAMEAGFPVVVEKPAAVTASDWDEMTACARRNGVFLMEAVWTCCFPPTLRTLEIIRSGRIGRVRNLQTTFAFRNPDDYVGRLYDPMLAGGALLDVGVYCLHYARMILGEDPVETTALASVDTDGLHLKVDEQIAVVSRYSDGALAVSNAAIRTEMPDTAVIYGTEGSIRVPDFWKPERLEILCADGCEIIEDPVPQRVPGVRDEGYRYEILHVNECLRKGLRESPLVPHEATASVLRQCDLIRDRCGLRFPFE